MLVEEVRCADDHNKVNTDSPLLNWQKVQDPTDNDDVNEEYLKTIQELYTGWISCCDKIVDKVEKLMLEDDSRREDSNPVVLLRRWCNIPSRGGKMELGKIIEEESYLHGRLSTVCTGHVTISWKARIELYKLTLQNYPRFREKDTAFACFVGSLSDVSANIKDTQDLARAVQRLADSSGCSTVDEYLGFTQAEDTHGAGKKRGLSSPSSDEHRSHTDGKRQRFEQSKAPQKELASAKLGLPAEIQGAKEALIGRLDKPQRLPGANRYYGRIRRLRAPGSSEEPDHPDHPDQTMAYEVWWDSAVSHKNSQRSERPSVPVDFSVPLINKLTEAQQAQFRSELQTFIDNGWWKEVPVRGSQSRMGTVAIV
ncbi:hypothetical protein FOZ60_014840 [Perkinsus olseni]|uniref:Uncharacterized protein n=1 Tax=Perkinsus olseni TaxID=32597 RepID=A0A7J6N763_PEROL|nr:hypothetical protein FOZ60_014840 [Perkinsus olseni]